MTGIAGCCAASGHVVTPNGRANQHPLAAKRAAFRLWPDFPPLLAPQESEQPLISLGLRLACQACRRGGGHFPRRTQSEGRRRHV